METVKYILNFFFGPGCAWHFLGLCVLCAFLGGSKYTNIHINQKDDE